MRFGIEDHPSPPGDCGRLSLHVIAMHRKLAETVLSIQKGIASSKRPEDRELATEYMAALAPILASAVLGNDVLADVTTIDRRFGQTRLVDVGPFRDAFDQWISFREEYRRFVLGGMTTNERLFADGKLDAFNVAQATKDVDQLERILRDVYLDEPSIQMLVAHMKKSS